MQHRDMIFIAIAVAAIAVAFYAMTRPVQVDIAPAPSKPLPDDVVGESDGPPNRTPSVSAYHGMFLYPLAFSRPLPITSTRMQ